jgi:cyclophilin family peptidyl-prolyl cis-trans isomerase
MKFMYSAVVCAGVILSGCGYMPHVFVPPAGSPEVLVSTPTGQAIVRLVPTQPALTQGLRTQVHVGRYAPTNVVRVVPGYLAMVGDAGYDDQTPVILPVANTSNHKSAARGQVGLLTLPSGQHKPQLIFMLGNRWSPHTAPSNTLVGYIISGQNHLENLVRGDTITLTLKR